jgi:hypothetical protein
MTDWQQRVLEERAALAEKLEKLKSYLARGYVEDEALLKEQANWMEGYLFTLDRRIAKF